MKKFFAILVFAQFVSTFAYSEVKFWADLPELTEEQRDHARFYRTPFGDILIEVFDRLLLMKSDGGKSEYGYQFMWSSKLDPNTKSESIRAIRQSYFNEMPRMILEMKEEKLGLDVIETLIEESDLTLSGKTIPQLQTNPAVAFEDGQPTGALKFSRRCKNLSEALYLELHVPTLLLSWVFNELSTPQWARIFGISAFPHEQSPRTEFIYDQTALAIAFSLAAGNFLAGSRSSRAGPYLYRRLPLPLRRSPLFNLLLEGAGPPLEAALILATSSAAHFCINALRALGN